MNDDVHSRFDDALRTALGTMHIDLSDAQESQLLRHYQLVLDTNRKFNLTRITEPEEFAVTLLADSLSLLAWARDGGHRVDRVLDIGTGAGLPAVPLAIARPDWHVTAIDGTGKKARFVKEVAEELTLRNLEARHERAESWRDRKRFDVVTLKAIGPLERCIRLAAPHVRRGGWVVVYKTMSLTDTERIDGLAATKERGFDTPSAYEYELTLHDATLRRALWVHRSPSSRH